LKGTRKAIGSEMVGFPIHLVPIHRNSQLDLARVSLVDSSGTCLLDDLVRPPNRILNYLTRFKSSLTVSTPTDVQPAPSSR
uniref:Uncharacterized protein n=1 Tax=Gadus morhua TaxID=8049 RepID=A0A8C5AJW9_GADMO